jgi:RHH-type proline utilization regulon transcriptional repressor/proline dehydrogenase/delta 1-pyrroline-5-carboxylate dehydrogenase
LTDDELIARSVSLAGELMSRSKALGTVAEHRRQAKLRRLLASPNGARLVFGLADRVLRPEDPVTAAAQLREFAGGPLEGLSAVDATLLRAAALASTALPLPVVALAGARLRYETRGLIFPAEAPRLGKALGKLRRAGYRPNLNLLGEAVLGEDEAGRRLSALKALLRRRDVDCISVKASAVAAGLSLVDLDGSVERVSEPLRRLYHLAGNYHPAKLVNLDMEEHRDLDITVTAFTRTLAAPELGDLVAGIALQAYLPDSHAALDQLLAFAAARARAGGAPVRVRLVKGANLAMERATAELANWPAAPYATKAETDASYKALLERLLLAARSGLVEVGAASHNLFDIAFALELARALGTHVEVEMLAGMADEQAAAVLERTGGLMLYAPAVHWHDFRHALAYLARRLDENATPEGFLRHALSMVPGSPEWAEQASLFESTVRARHSVRTSPAQTQDRSQPPAALACAQAGAGERPAAAQQFFNEPATDLAVRANRQWAAGVLARAHSPDVRLLEGEEAVRAVEHAVARGSRGHASWEALGEQARAGVLWRAAAVMADGRGEAIEVMAGEAGKTFEEADPEVSEGVDYARWYAAGAGSLGWLVASLDLPVRSRPLGLVVVAPPWNFPYAIPAGSTLAALAAGNAVILKPAPEAPATSALLVRQLKAAGLPEETLQLLPIADGEAGRRLVAHPSVSGVVLTGSYATAELFARWAPGRRLLAETSGKNAIVVGATADVDEAVRDLVSSAFGHAGQKCSAASLAIVVASVYDGGSFLRQLADAVRSLRVGPATDPATQVGPIVGPLTPALERALTRLDPGERWLVRPLQVGPRLWAPGVRTGVKPYSWAHTTEWFGPVLAVMRARDIDEALAWQNAVAYGLTAGLSSLDPQEHKRWADEVKAGNLYINRSTTGAIVGRQPFGGWKRSSYGPTAKTGGPNYLIGLRRWQDAESGVSFEAAAASYRRWWESHFSGPRELAGLRSESNELRYKPFTPGVVVRAGAEVLEDDLAKALLLSELTGTPLRFSLERLPDGARRGAGPLTGAQIVVESDESFAASLAGAQVVAESDESFASSLAGEVRIQGGGRPLLAAGSRRDKAGALGKGHSGHGGKKSPGASPQAPARLRLLGHASPVVLEAAAAAGYSVLDEPICSCGRIELVRWLREQVVTRSLHRYGNIVYSRW